MEVGEGFSTSSSTKHVGFSLTSEDGKQVFQVRLDGFAMIRLAPYASWDPFRDEARRLWNNYRESTHPVKVDRMAVRYVNRLELPLPLVDFKEYLRTVPEVSPDLPQSLAGFFMQLNIPELDIASTLLLNQTIIDSPRRRLSVSYLTSTYSATRICRLRTKRFGVSLRTCTLARTRFSRLVSQTQ